MSALVGRFGWESLGADALNEVRLFASTTSLLELRTAFNAEVAKDVQGIIDADADYDAFDLIEFMRLRELPLTPVLGLREGHDGSAAAIELASLVLLSRPARMVDGQTRTAPIPDTRCRRCGRGLRDC